MKNINIMIISLMIFLLNSCGTTYSYPNYDIIKPKVSYKPKRENIKKLISSYIDKPYVWAEEGPYAFDCSGLTYNIYGKMGVTLPRVAKDQAKVGKEIKLNELAYGDLIFFGNKNRRSKKINHVGIYIGDGWFAHASSVNRKVMYSNFNITRSYYKRIKTFRRYLSIDEKSIYLNEDGTIPKYKTTRFTTPWQPNMKVPLTIPS